MRDSKNSLRALLKQKRQTLSLQEREAAAFAAAKVFAESMLYFSNNTFSTYLATEYELNLQPIIHILWETKKSVYLPSVAKTLEKEMQFKAYHASSTLRPNRYNILEPNTQEHILATELDVVLLPLVGFDLQGFRLGAGGGHYDATFAFLRTDPRPMKPLLIGVGFESQQVEEVPHEEWDVVLDGVLTEERLLFF